MWHRKTHVENKTFNNFNSLYSHYYKRSFLFTKSYVHDTMVAEDIVSDVLIKLWSILKENSMENFDGLLLTMLKNRSLDYLKHELIKADAFQEIKDIHQRELNIRISTLEACNPDELLSTEIQEIVTKTLSLLPEQSRLIFELSRYSNKTNKEIAEELNVSIKTVEYHITRTLKQHRTDLKDYLPFFLFLFY